MVGTGLSGSVPSVGMMLAALARPYTHVSGTAASWATMSANGFKVSTQATT